MFGISPAFCPDSALGVEFSECSRRNVTALRHILQKLAVVSSTSEMRTTSGLAGQLTVLSYLASPEHPGDVRTLLSLHAFSSNTTLEDTVTKPEVMRVILRGGRPSRRSGVSE